METMTRSLGRKPSDTSLTPENPRPRPSLIPHELLEVDRKSYELLLSHHGKGSGTCLCGACSAARRAMLGPRYKLSKAFTVHAPSNSLNGARTRRRSTAGNG